MPKPEIYDNTNQKEIHINLDTLRNHLRDLEDEIKRRKNIWILFGVFLPFLTTTLTIKNYNPMWGIPSELWGGFYLVATIFSGGWMMRINR